jgi:hypothetical protein
MEAGSAFDVVESVEGRDMFVDDGLVDRHPKRFGRSQFGRIGREEDEAHAVEHAQARFAMPTSVVENEHDGSVNATGKE